MSIKLWLNLDLSITKRQMWRPQKDLQQLSVTIENPEILKLSNEGKVLYYSKMIRQ